MEVVLCFYDMLWFYLLHSSIHSYGCWHQFEMSCRSSHWLIVFSNVVKWLAPALLGVPCSQWLKIPQTDPSVGVFSLGMFLTVSLI